MTRAPKPFTLVAVITGLYAGILTLFYIGLALHVVHGRWKFRVGIGHADNNVLIRRIRVHGNFAEYVPLALVLMMICEMGHLSPAVIHALGGALVLARILHAYGLGGSDGTSMGRFVGTVLSFVVLLGAAVGAIGSYV